MATSETIAAPAPVTDGTEEVPAVEGGPHIPDAPAPRRRRRGSRRKMAIAAGTVIVLGAALGVWLGTGSSASSSPLVVTTQVVGVTTGTMKETQSASGTIEPSSTADLSFGVSGQVTAVDVVTGQTVKAGQVLATVDPSALEVDVESAQASLAAAQDKLSTDESDSADASQIDSDQASATTAQTQLTTAQTDVTEAGLTSTISGTVASVDLTVGQQVTGSTSTSTSSTGSGGTTGLASTAATAASTAASTASSSAASSSSATSSSDSAQITVISTASYTVSTTVDDTQVGEVKVGDQAVITPEGSTTDVYGTVTSVGLVASSTSTVAAFPVTIAVTGNPTGLYAGSTATVSIVTKEIANAIQVPTAAISYSGGKATVTEVVNGSNVVRSVTTGQVSDGDTQITSGLTSGDKVVERVVKFNASAAGGGRSLFGGTSSGGSTGGFPGGGRAAGGTSGGAGGGGFGG
jgi:multidrug efflux pump subunit AcrA (membrane-fusion protein)